MSDTEPSYIDYETFLDPDFSAHSFANTLVLATNNPTDTPLDLSTPLSRVLFDVQEVDTHIDSLTTKSGLPLIEYTKTHADASERILREVEGQVATLAEGYKALEKEVIERYETAEQVRLAAERLCETVRLGRVVARCLMLGRQLEAQMTELGSSTGIGKREDHRTIVRASNTLLSIRQILRASNPGQEGEGIERVNLITTLRDGLIAPSERHAITRSQQIVREFSISAAPASTASAQPPNPASSYSQMEDMKSRTTSALLALYLLSPVPPEATPDTFRPTLLIGALQDFLQTALKSSLAWLSRALATLPALDRALLEISAQCQNVVALEALLESIKPPPHPILAQSQVAAQPTSGEFRVETPPHRDFLQPLLQSLDTSSLPSYFWRSLASSLSPRVQEILNRGGVSARTLRSNKERVREAVRECVNRGSQLPVSPLSRGKGLNGGNWEREAAVMVGAIVGLLGR